MHLLPTPRRARMLAALLLALAIPALPASAQKVIPAPAARPSPTYIAAETLPNGTYVKVTYSSPQRRNPETGENRVIFGQLIPYGEVWRLGANEATEITTTGDLNFAGKRLPAGTYALFTIPQQDHWTIIVNKILGQWGAFSYEKNKGQDLFHVDVPVQKTPDTYDAFTMTFDDKGSNLNMNWENTYVVIPIKAWQ